MLRSDDPTGESVPEALRHLVIGATGQLGSELLDYAACHPEVGAAQGTARVGSEMPRLDLADVDSIDGVIAETRPAHALLAAAATNVAWCERDPAGSELVNVRGTAAVARACRDHGVALTFFSTDYVFDGADGPYPESAQPAPINVYGAHKLAAENEVLSASPVNLVIRTCQLFGADPGRRNYVLRVADSLVRNEEVPAATDLYGTPTFAPDLARLVYALRHAREAGLWHVAGPRFLSRHELALCVARAVGRGERLVVPVTAGESSDGVPRPLRAGLRSTRLGAIGMAEMTPLEVAIGAIVRREAAA